jgi:hypothetical protein
MALLFKKSGHLQGSGDVWRVFAQAGAGLGAPASEVGVRLFERARDVGTVVVDRPLAYRSFCRHGHTCGTWARSLPTRRLSMSSYRLGLA